MHTPHEDERLVVHVSGDLKRWLKSYSASTGKTMSLIVEEHMNKLRREQGQIIVK